MSQAAVAQKPADDIDLPSRGKIELRAVVRLPKEYRLEPQKAHQATSAFASYRSTYEVKDGKLTVDRVLETTKSKVPSAAWDEYRKVSNGVYDDHNEWMNLVAAEATRLFQIILKPRRSWRRQAASLTPRKSLRPGQTSTKPPKRRSGAAG